MTVGKVGIMTGGGDCPGLNAVIRAAVKVGLRKHGWEMLGIADAFEGLIDPAYDFGGGNQWLTNDDTRHILRRGGTILGTSNRSHPFEYVEDGAEETTDVSGLCLENMKKLGLDAIISIGGDGSMGIANRFHELGMPIVGVPKTIDNDLDCTDVTFGFSTAVETATEAIDRIQDTAESHDRVMLVEVMGRDAGWIALHAGVAGGAHAILIPEIPYSLDAVARRIDDRFQRGQPHTVVVVAEGAKPVGGEQSIKKKQLGGMPQLGGAAHRIAAGLKDLGLRHDMRVTVLGHIQRGGAPIARDRILGTRFGHHAADLVAAGDFGKMVALRDGRVVAVPLSEATKKQKLVEPDHQLVQSARAIGVFFGDELD